jgi:5'-nucleotidase
MTRPFILITNDDGIHAAGIKHVWEALFDFADLAIVAPLTEKSGSGLGTTLTKPLQPRAVIWEKETPAWSVNGTPGDCVKMALSVLLKRKPDLIVSGVNRGSNAGRTIYYSGTVGAVIEGTLRKIPGIALSFQDFAVPILGTMSKHISSLVQHFLKHPLPLNSFLNVTFNSKCEEKIEGFRMARQGQGYWIENTEERIHPEGVPYYWLGGRWSHHEEHPESDVALLKEGYLTAVPIHIGELTDHLLLDQHRDSIQNLFQNPILKV